MAVNSIGLNAEGEVGMVFAEVGGWVVGGWVVGGVLPRSFGA
jgi:hypothetical protein